MHNISDRDCFNVVKVTSAEEALLQIVFGVASRRYLHRDATKRFEQLLSNYLINKNSFMNEKNYEYLTDLLQRTGFGDTMNAELRKNMEVNNKEFTLLQQTAYSTDRVNATLHFKRSDEFDMVFFNKYELALKKENNDEAIKQTFYPDKHITLKEGYNMLDGRAVHKTLTNKEGEQYQAWLQLDFKETTDSGNFRMKQFHHNYGFDLEQTLSKYPIKELQNEQYKASLIRSLERGNLQSATFTINGKEEKIFLTPNIAFKALTAFDANMNKIKLSELMQGQKQDQSNKQDNTQKQTAKPETKVAGDDAQKNGQKKTRKQKVT